MPSLVVHPTGTAPLASRATLGHTRVASLACCLAIIAAAIVQQSTIGINPDTSWLITVSERVLAGDRLYVDVFELNPPASVLTIMPAVLLAALFQLRPEAVVVGGMIALAIGSALLFVRLLRGADLLGKNEAPWVMVATLFALLLLPGMNFAQREHIALVVCLPWLALMAVRAGGGGASRGMLVLAGLGVGVTAMVKPHFLLVIALPLLVLAWRRRSLRPIFGLETMICAAVVATYVASTFVLTPEFWTIAVPLVSEGYLQQRQPLFQTLTMVPALLSFSAIGTAAAIEGRALPRRATLMLLLGAAAFEAAVLVQGKGFWNHQYPVLALGLIALAMALTRRNAPVGERRIGLLLGLVVAGAASVLTGRMHLYPEVAALIRSHAPQRPTMIMAGSNLTVAHPLTRWVDGRWVGTRGSMWASSAARELLAGSPDPSQRIRLEAQVAEDRRLWLADVAKGLPDVILVWEREGLQWVGPGPDLAAALRPYRKAGSAQGVTVLVRTP